MPRMRRATKAARITIIVVAVAKVLATPWGVALSTAGALASAAALWLADWDHVRYWLASLGTFVGLMWALVAVVWLGSRQAPQIVRAHRDYAYGLTFEGIAAHYDPTNEAETLGFGVVLRNYSPGPIRYVIEEFDVRIQNRAIPRLKKGQLTSIMSRGAGRTSTTVPFGLQDIKDFTGARVEGTIEFVIAYGHPEEDPERHLRMLLKIILDFTKPPHVGVGTAILEESDKPIGGA